MPSDNLTQRDVADLSSRGRFRWMDAIGWTWLVVVAGFLVLFVLPRKGVEFSDEGWVLSASLGAAHGWHLDPVVPQAPMWALNSLLMLAGVESYIAMRWLFYGLISTCLAVAFVAVDSRRRACGLKVGLVTLAGLTALSSLVSYNTTPHYLILAGTGLFVLATDARGPARLFLAGLSGLAFSSGGFLNFTLYPAALFSLALAWASSGRPRYAWVTLTTLVVVSGTAVAWYVHRIGLQMFLSHPGGHGLDKRRVLVASLIVLEWLIPAWTIWGAAAFFMRYRSDEQRRQATHAVAAALVLGFSLLFLSYLLYRLNISTFARRLDPVLHALNTVGLTGLGTLNVGLPGHILGIWGVATLVSTVVLCRTTDHVYRRVRLYAGCLCICYFWQEFFSLMDPRHLLIYYAGPCMALGFYLLLRHPAGLAARLMSGTALAATLAGGLAFSVYYNHPNLNPVLGPKIDVTLPKLAGLRESPERADTLLRLVEAFDSYGCRERTFVTFHATPILHYLFDVEPQDGLEYLYVPYIFNPNRVLQTLEQSRSWCVLASWNWLDWPTPGSKPGTEPVMDYLRQYSNQIVRLSPRARPVHAYDDFVLYLGPTMVTGQARRSAPEKK